MIFKIYNGEINTVGFFREVNQIRQGKKTALNYQRIDFFGVSEQLGEQGELASVSHQVYEIRNNRRIKRDLFFFGVIGRRGCFLSNSKFELGEITDIFNGLKM